MQTDNFIVMLYDNFIKQIDSSKLYKNKPIIKIKLWQIGRQQIMQRNDY